MKKKWLWILSILLIFGSSMFKTTVAHAEDDEEYISGEGVNKAFFEIGTETDADEELETVDINSAPEVKVDGYLTYSQAVEYVRSQMVKRKSGFQVMFAWSEDLEIDGVYEMFLSDVCAETDSPVEGDYLLLHYRNYGYKGSRKRSSTYNTYLYTITITFKYLSTATEESILNDEVDRIIKKLNLASDNEYQKVKKIYDYMTSTIEYDYDAMEMLSAVEYAEAHKDRNDTTDYYSLLDRPPYWGAWSAYGAAVKKTCVCQGYANLFYRLAREAGLSVRSIRGKSRGGSHAWNIVRIGKYFYNVDATWDAGERNYSYFLKNTYDFSNHTRSIEYTTSNFSSTYPTSSVSFDPSTYDANAYATQVSIAQGAKYNLCIGNTKAFSANVLPSTLTNKNITWSSSDTNVATVDSTGKVTAKKLGTAIITARSKNNSTVYDTCLVTVTNTGWVYSYGVWHYYEKGVRVVGWKKLSNNWYYFDSYGDMVTGWVKYSGNWYYFASDGIMKKGWLKVDGDWYYLAADGTMTKGWLKKGDYWYYFNAYGIMKTGWVKYDGKWYFFNEAGQMQKGWLLDEEGWHYLGADGTMTKGWLKKGDYWYYFNAYGIMKTGWVKIDGSWYFFNEEGQMQKGWLEVNEKKYYLGSDGVMVTGTIIIDDEEYSFDETGVLVQTQL